MALVRVYCGLASAEQPVGSASAGTSLTATVVDDAGRLLDVCEISDDPAGYARLGVLLAERSHGPTAVAVAVDSEEHTVTELLAAAGSLLAFADDEAVDDYAERFADDGSAEEIHSPPAERRAVGLARALQAGALSASAMPTPRSLVGFKPMLAAHAALVDGRQSIAVALREVLREVYPAALRAYPDPAEPICLAVLDALPEPGLLASPSNGRGRESAAAIDAVAARLTQEGVADAETIDQAITALRVAVAETPRRSGINKSLTGAAAEAVRQAVAAVRACDAACETLVGTLAGRSTGAATAPARRASRRSSSPAPAPASAPPAPPAPPAPLPPAPLPPAAAGPEPPATPSRVPTPPPRRVRPQPAAAHGTPVTPQPMMSPPVAPAPVAPPPVAPAPMTPTRIVPAAAAAPLPVRVPAPPATPTGAPVSTPPAAPSSAPPAPARFTDPARFNDPLPARPVSAPPPPPPGITPIVPGQRSTTPIENGEPFRATATAAAINSARAERRRAAMTDPRDLPELSPVDAPPPPGIGATSIPVPAPRPVREPALPAPPAPPGARANWPLTGSTDDRAADAYALSDLPPSELDRPSQLERPSQPAQQATERDGRVTPPWLADDLPPEPPTLRLVEPPLAERAVRDDLGRMDEFRPEFGGPPPLRLVEPDAPGAESSNGGSDSLASPVAAEGDGDLLIFAAARSAWFVGHDDEDVEWSSSADQGWRAAEQAARPAVGAETSAGLPRRVPQANLVPGSPLRDDRPLRIVRDPASIAAHTTGYFRGWRRGQEIGGYAVGGRPGRESAGGWDFTRDHEGRDETRSAGYRG